MRPREVKLRKPTTPGVGLWRLQWVHPQRQFSCQRVWHFWWRPYLTKGFRFIHLKRLWDQTSGRNNIGGQICGNGWTTLNNGRLHINQLYSYSQKIIFKNFLDIEDIFDSKTDPKCANVPENLQLLFFLRKWGVGGWVKGCLELFQKIIRFGEGWLP